MTAYAIETAGLTRRLGDVRVIDDWQPRLLGGFGREIAEAG
jgi:hypothetical protein